MYAVIKTGGKQYKVAPGQRLKVESLSVEEGQDVDFEEVLMVVDGDKSEIGAPLLTGRGISVLSFREMAYRWNANREWL